MENSPPEYECIDAWNEYALGLQEKLFDLWVESGNNPYDLVSFREFWEKLMPEI